MRLKMAPNSLFAILLRSSWWISFAIALAMAAVARLVLPEPYAPYALFTALPFLVIGAVAAFRQLRQPSAARVNDTLAAVGAMAWPAFADAVERALREDGHAVERLQGSAADFTATRAGRVTLVSCRRWKAARTGIEPLRELQAAMAARDAAAGLYVGLGEPTDAAVRFAADHGIELMRGQALAVLLRRQALKKG